MVLKPCEIESYYVGFKNHFAAIEFLYLECLRHGVDAIGSEHGDVVDGLVTLIAVIKEGRREGQLLAVFLKTQQTHRVLVLIITQLQQFVLYRPKQTLFVHVSRDACSRAVNLCEIPKTIEVAIA